MLTLGEGKVYALAAFAGALVGAGVFGVLYPRLQRPFRLPALPFGHYQVHAWHPAYGEIRREVELRDPRGARIELDF